MNMYIVLIKCLNSSKTFVWEVISRPEKAEKHDLPVYELDSESDRSRRIRIIQNFKANRLFFADE